MREEFIPEQLETTGTTISSGCEITKAQLLYSPYCGWCQKQLTDGSLDELQTLGVELEVIDVVANNISVQAVPTWRFDNKEETGYKTIDQLKEMLGC